MRHWNLIGVLLHFLPQPFCRFDNARLETFLKAAKDVWRNVFLLNAVVGGV